MILRSIFLILATQLITTAFAFAQYDPRKFENIPVYMRSVNQADGRTMKVAGSTLNYKEFIKLLYELKVDPGKTHDVHISIPIDKLNDTVLSLVEQVSAKRPDLNIEIIPQTNITKLLQEKHISWEELDPDRKALRSFAKTFGLKLKPLSRYIRSQNYSQKDTEQIKELTQQHVDLMKDMYNKCEHCSLTKKLKRKSPSIFDGLYLTVAGGYTAFYWHSEVTNGIMTTEGGISAALLSLYFAYAFSFHRDDTRWQEKLSRSISSYYYAKGETHFAETVDGPSRFLSQLGTTLALTALMRGAVLGIGHGAMPGFGPFIVEVVVNALIVQWVSGGISARLGKWENSERKGLPLNRKENSPFTQNENRFIQQLIKVTKIFAFVELNSGPEVVDVILNGADPTKLKALWVMGGWGALGTLFYLRDPNKWAQNIENSKYVMPKIRSAEKMFGRTLEKLAPGLMWMTKLENFLAQWIMKQKNNAKNSIKRLPSQFRTKRSTAKKMSCAVAISSL